MARQKNALTGYFVAPCTEDAGTELYEELAKWISTVSDESDEEVEDTAWYDGDGTEESDVTAIKKAYTFEGMYDDTNAAMNLIADMEFEKGEGRRVMFKQVRTDGTVLEGLATVTEIKVTGGDAADFAPFECTITWNQKPVDTTVDVLTEVTA